MPAKSCVFSMSVAMILLPMSACTTRSPERMAELMATASQELICEDEAACRRMWIRASRWVEENSGGYRSVKTEFNCITVWCSFARSDAYYVAYIIERVPIKGEKSRLTLTFGPESTVIPCAPTDTLAAEANFKRAVLG